MRRTVTVSLPEDLGEELDSVSTREGTTRSEVVREALRRYCAPGSTRFTGSASAARAREPTGC